MNIDIRVNTDFFGHPKTLILQRELGEIAPMFVIRLWIFVSKFFPDGTIRSVQDDIIEEQIGWSKNHDGNFIQTLEKIGFIERKGENIVIHDWEEHNPWASAEKNRKGVNRLNILSRYFPQVAEILKENGVSEVTGEQYKAIKASANPLKEAATIFKLKSRKIEDISYVQSNVQSNLQSYVRPYLQSNVQSYYDQKLPHTNTNTKTKAVSKTKTNIKNSKSPERQERSELVEISETENQTENIFIDIPLNDGTAYLVKNDSVRLWQELFPACSIEQELRSMKAWSLANPKKRKTRRGVEKFISGWLDRAQNNPRPAATAPLRTNYASPDKTSYVMEQNKQAAQRWLEREQKKQEAQNGYDDNRQNAESFRDHAFGDEL